MNPIIDDFIDFIQQSPTAWHAVEWMRHTLTKANYQELSENTPWNLKPNKRYFVTRGGSSLCCFHTPQKIPHKAQILGAHTDSPGLKLKPSPEYHKEDATMLGVEVYGSPLLSSWLNRDLGLAGRIVYRDTEGKRQENLVNLNQAPFILPQLAIHLDREVNDEGLKLNKQNNLPVLATLGQHNKNYLLELLRQHLPIDSLLASDLLFYPLEPPRLIGKNKELLSSYRLDNLSGVHTSLTALLQQNTIPENTLPLAIFWDHEEVGSNTTLGASSTFLSNTLERIALSYNMNREEQLCMHSRSLLASVDLAHATHPNYSDKHDEQHKIYLNKGIVIKINAKQRYATEATLNGLISDLCHTHKLPLQYFVGHNNTPCGSTIGPLASTHTGIPTIDIGCAELSMHSARELMGCQDHIDMCTLLTKLLLTEH